MAGIQTTINDKRKIIMEYPGITTAGVANMEADGSSRTQDYYTGQAELIIRGSRSRSRSRDTATNIYIGRSIVRQRSQACVAGRLACRGRSFCGTASYHSSESASLSRGLDLMYNSFDMYIIMYRICGSS
jgi:hypothetical protein